MIMAVIRQSEGADGGTIGYNNDFRDHFSACCK